jgi:hypothetical protein
LLSPLLKRTKTITLDTDWPFRIAGEKFIWFCEKPLTSFASSVDSGMKRITSHFSVFGSLEETKSRPRNEPMPTVSIGTAVLLIIIFFLMYLIVVLMYGWLAP